MMFLYQINAFAIYAKLSPKGTKRYITHFGLHDLIWRFFGKFYNGFGHYMFLVVLNIDIIILLCIIFLEDSFSRICGKKDEECSTKAKCKF